MDFNVLRFGFLGNEDVGEDNGDDEENDDKNQTLTQVALCFSHPGDTAVFLFLGAMYFAFRVMMA